MIIDLYLMMKRDHIYLFKDAQKISKYNFYKKKLKTLE